MSNQAISNLGIPSLDKKPVAFQQNGQLAMQGTVGDGVRQAVDKTVDTSYLSNRVNASKEANPAAVLGATAGSWYLISQGMDKFNPACAGEYEKSILGKLGGWGDKFSKNTWVGRKLESGLGWIGKQVNKLAGKSKIVRSLTTHSTRPEWGFAKVPGAGLHGFLAQDTEHVFEEFLKPITNRSSMQGLTHTNAIQKLEQYGLSQKDIDAFAQRLKGKPFRVQALALQRKELSVLGVDSKVIDGIYRRKGLTGLQEYAKHLKVRMLGFKSMKEYNALKGKFLDNPKKVVQALENAVKNNPNLKVSIWRSNGTASGVSNHLFGRTVHLSEYLNKYKATLGLGNTTKLGKFLPKALGWLAEGGTNRFAGGKLGVLMQAYIFGDMLVNTWNAPKGEKGKTLAERLVNDFSYFLAMPLGIWAMHKVGGFKFAGLDAKGVEAYRKALEKLNAKNARGGFASKKAYSMAVKELNKKLGTANIKNPITKLLQKIGKFINMGNERIIPYKSAAKWNMNWLRALKNSNILGVPLRLVISMMMISPFVAKWATKGVHAIFGRPTHSVLDDEPEEPQEPQQNVPFQGQGSQGQSQNPATQAATTKPVQPVNPNDFEDTNYIKQTINGKKTAETTVVPDTSSNRDSAEPVRTYIPSPEAVVLQDEEDATSAQMALARADIAERRINDILKGRKL
ncbi:MAG: hypothetical protein NC191_02890 [Muribaculaceae bacterium]|nr:hypothetical protein [Muribaculaceae bacterium]